MLSILTDRVSTDDQGSTSFILNAYYQIVIEISILKLQPSGYLEIRD